MTFNKKSCELGDSRGRFLPILDNVEFKECHKAIDCLYDGDKDGAIRHLYNILLDCGCTEEKDSVCDFLASIINITYYFNEKKAQMLEDLEYVIYQMF